MKRIAFGVYQTTYNGSTITLGRNEDNTMFWFVSGEKFHVEQCSSQFRSDYFNTLKLALNDAKRFVDTCSYDPTTGWTY